MVPVKHAAFHLQGIDAGDTVYWSWFGPDGASQHSQCPRSLVDELSQHFDNATPGGARIAADATLPDLFDQVQSSGLPRGFLNAVLVPGVSRNILTSALWADRARSGALADAEGERRLCGDAGALLLPPALIVALRDHLRTGSVPRLMVLPPRSCSQIPWAILRSSAVDDERLLELAEVVLVGPALSRDGRTEMKHVSWESVRHHPVLHIVDPKHPRFASMLRHDEVLDQRRDWETYLADLKATTGRSAGVVQSESVTRQWLSRELRERSAVLFAGHVVEAEQEITDAQAAHTGMVICPSRPGPTLDPLTAAELVVGSDRSLEPPWGRDEWVWPPRVALIACQSGADLKHPEPLGLVTAILEGGAELVLATLWPLLSDPAHFLLTDDHESTDAPFNELVRGALEVLHAAEPFAALRQWQMLQLRRWRDKPGIGTSPVSWAALVPYFAPERTYRVSQRKADHD